MRAMEKAAIDPVVKSNPAWKIVLVGAPVFLLVSGVIALVTTWIKSENKPIDPRLGLSAKKVSAREIESLRQTLQLLPGETTWETAAGRQNLRSTTKFIQGLLGEPNYGIGVTSGHFLTFEKELWPAMWGNMGSDLSEGDVILVPARYDRGVEEFLVVLVAANELRGDSFDEMVRFVFYSEELFEREGKTRQVFVGEEETLRGEVWPEVDGPEGGSWTAEQLEVVARKLVRKVRDLARTE